MRKFSFQTFQIPRVHSNLSSLSRVCKNTFVGSLVGVDPQRDESKGWWEATQPSVGVEFVGLKYTPDHGNIVRYNFPSRIS